MSQYLPAVDIYNYTPSLCVYNTPHHRHQLLLNIFKQREVRKYFYLFSFHRDKNVNISTPSQSSYLLSWVSEELLGNVFQRKQMCSLPCAGLSLKHALKLLKNNKIFTVLPPGPRSQHPARCGETECLDLHCCDPSRCSPANVCVRWSTFFRNISEYFWCDISDIYTTMRAAIISPQQQRLGGAGAVQQQQVQKCYQGANQFTCTAANTTNTTCNRIQMCGNFTTGNDLPGPDSRPV